MSSLRGIQEGPVDRLAAMASFVRIVESGSLSAAARAQGQSLAAVSRQLGSRAQRVLAQPTQPIIRGQQEARLVLTPC
jgi:hypothetical protein